MEIVVPPTDLKRHIKMEVENVLIFNANAVEITVLDRWGKHIWKKRRGESLEPIRWNGLELDGRKAVTGAYTCKLVYPDNLTVYVPFLFIQK